MLINNIRQLQIIAESSDDEQNIIIEIISSLKNQLKIDIVLADRNGKSIFNSKFNPSEYFYKIPLVAMYKKYGMLYVNGIDNLNQMELAYFYAAIPLLSMAISNIYLKSDGNIKRQIAAARIVIGSLTRLEIKALKSVFSHLDNSGGIIVISRVSRENNITRSLIVNALKKIESAGIIDTASLGMKGTKIIIINKYFFSELKDC